MFLELRKLGGLREIIPDPVEWQRNLRQCAPLLISISSTKARASVSVSVPGTANIFGAGDTTPPAPGGGSGGTLPIDIAFTPGAGLVLTVPSVTGAVSLTPSEPASGGDGGTTQGTNISSYAGISGIRDDNGLGFLVGVFLSSNQPVDPAPTALDFTNNTAFTSLSPVIDQTFYIGDGLTGTGTGAVQQFNVPATADQLVLGFADGYGLQGPPGEYQDNVGSLNVTVNVPEPTSALSVLAFSAALLRRCQAK